MGQFFPFFITLALLGAACSPVKPEAGASQGETQKDGGDSGAASGGPSKPDDDFSVATPVGMSLDLLGRAFAPVLPASVHGSGTASPTESAKRSGQACFVRNQIRTALYDLALVHSSICYAALVSPNLTTSTRWSAPETAGTMALRFDRTGPTTADIWVCDNSVLDQVIHVTAFSQTAMKGTFGITYAAGGSQWTEAGTFDNHFDNAGALAIDVRDSGNGTDYFGAKGPIRIDTTIAIADAGVTTLGQVYDSTSGIDSFLSRFNTDFGAIGSLPASATHDNIPPLITVDGKGYDVPSTLPVFAAGGALHTDPTEAASALPADYGTPPLTGWDCSGAPPLTQVIPDDQWQACWAIVTSGPAAEDCTASDFDPSH